MDSRTSATNVDAVTDDPVVAVLVEVAKDWHERMGSIRPVVDE